MQAILIGAGGSASHMFFVFIEVNLIFWASQWLRGKECNCSAGEADSIPGLGRSPGGGHGNPFQYSCLENPHGQRSLVGYSPWGHKELDTTE